MGTGINERSIYFKIQAILGCALSEKNRIGSLEHLHEAVARSRSPAFTYFRAHRVKGSELVACSEGLIQARVNLCVELGLVDSATGQLSKHGRDAMRKQSFGQVISRRVRAYLENKGFRLDLLKSPGRMAGNTFWLPTAVTLYEQGRVTLPFDDFRRLLNLLVECDSLQAIQSRLFLPPNTYEK